MKKIKWLYPLSTRNVRSLSKTEPPHSMYGIIPSHSRVGRKRGLMLSGVVSRSLMIVGIRKLI